MLELGIEILNKTLVLPSTTYSRLCSADQTCMKVLILARFLCPGVGMHTPPPKVMLIIFASLNLLERRYAHIQA